jgi:hypothetical protein
MVQLTESVGVRSALHHVLMRAGMNPVERDPWYFPTVKQYSSVSHNMSD